MKEQKIKTIIPKSESELESCVSRDLVKVKIIDSLPEFHVYLKINDYDMFISQNKIEKGKINCWYSQRKFLQFDENHGAIFNSFFSNFLLISNQYKDCKDFVELLKKAEKWEDN